MKERILTVALVGVGVFAGCDKGAQDAGAPQGAVVQEQRPAADAVAVVEAASAASGSVHEVTCGCSVEEIGRCTPLIRIGDETLELEADGVGEHEFCGKTGLKAEVTGAVKDGVFHAESFALQSGGGE